MIDFTADCNAAVTVGLVIFCTLSETDALRNGNFVAVDAISDVDAFILEAGTSLGVIDFGNENLGTTSGCFVHKMELINFPCAVIVTFPLPVTAVVAPFKTVGNLIFLFGGGLYVKAGGKEIFEEVGAFNANELEVDVTVVGFVAFDAVEVGLITIEAVGSSPS